MKSKKRSSQSPSAPALVMKKKKRTRVKSFQQQQQPLSSEFYLPDDCWEHVFSFVINPVDETEDKNKLCFKSSLSLVSKQFLSITNRLIFSLRMYYPQLCFLPRFFQRFSNLNSLDLWFASSHHLHHAAIALALRHRPTLKSLSIFGIDLKDANYVTSHYVDSFLSLKGLNSLKFQCSQISDDLLYSIAREGLPLESFVLENCIGYSYHGIYGLLSKCPGIRHLGLEDVDFLNNHHVSQLSLLLPDLVSINLTGCSKLTQAALFALIKYGHSLLEITMRSISSKRDNVEDAYNLKDFDVNPQLKSLYLSLFFSINDETLLLFASVLPNLQLLELTFCHNISKRGICQILSRCCKLRDLNSSFIFNIRGLKMNFIVHQLEVLDLSCTSVNDKTLYRISKSCCGLLELILIMCDYVTEKGVMYVVENCTQLKKIYLKGCDKVNVDAVISMLSLRPSLHVFSSRPSLLGHVSSNFHFSPFP